MKKLGILIFIMSFMLILPVSVFAASKSDFTVSINKVEFSTLSEGEQIKVTVKANTSVKVSKVSFQYIDKATNKVVKSTNWTAKDASDYRTSVTVNTSMPDAYYKLVDLKIIINNDSSLTYPYTYNMKSSSGQTAGSYTVTPSLKADSEVKAKQNLSFTVKNTSGTKNIKSARIIVRNADTNEVISNELQSVSTAVSSKSFSVKAPETRCARLNVEVLVNDGVTSSFKFNYTMLKMTLTRDASTPATGGTVSAGSKLTYNLKSTNTSRGARQVVWEVRENDEKGKKLDGATIKASDTKNGDTSMRAEFTVPKTASKIYVKVSVTNINSERYYYSYTYNVSGVVAEPTGTKIKLAITTDPKLSEISTSSKFNIKVESTNGVKIKGLTVNFVDSQTGKAVRSASMRISAGKLEANTTSQITFSEAQLKKVTSGKIKLVAKVTVSGTGNTGDTITLELPVKGGAVAPTGTEAKISITSDPSKVSVVAGTKIKLTAKSTNNVQLKNAKFTLKDASTGTVIRTITASATSATNYLEAASTITISSSDITKATSKSIKVEAEANPKDSSNIAGTSNILTFKVKDEGTGPAPSPGVTPSVSATASPGAGSNIKANDKITVTAISTNNVALSKATFTLIDVKTGSTIRSLGTISNKDTKTGDITLPAKTVTISTSDLNKLASDSSRIGIVVQGVSKTDSKLVSNNYQIEFNVTKPVLKAKITSIAANPEPNAKLIAGDVINVTVDTDRAIQAIKYELAGSSIPTDTQTINVNSTKGTFSVRMPSNLDKSVRMSIKMYIIDVDGNVQTTAKTISYTVNKSI